MHQTKEQEFLYVKEKLDYYHLPTNFPPQTAKLLSKLLQKLDHYTNNQNRLLIEQSQQQAQQNIQMDKLDKALRHETSKIVKQNNQLHMNIVTLKEQVQTLKHCLDKLAIQKSDSKSELRQIFFIKNQREKQLIQELNDVKYKYNELLDLIHQQDKIEKKYIKRLFNHKKLDQTQSELKKSKKQGSPSKLQKQIMSYGEMNSYQFHQKLNELQQKVYNRQTQILRLQKKLEFDGLNMNKILKDFQEDLAKKKIGSLSEQLEYLVAQNKRMSDQLQWAKKTGGRHQALRQQIQKSHEAIKELKSKNKKCNKNVKENSFDMSKKESKINRQMKKINDLSLNMKAVKIGDEIAITDLKKKVKYYEKEIAQLKAALNKQNNIHKSSKNDRKEPINNQENISSESINPLQNEKLSINQYLKENKQRQNRQPRPIPQQQEEEQIQNLEELLKEYRQKIRQLTGENLFYKKENQLKNQAIQNLQKIVAQFLRTNQIKDQNDSIEERREMLIRQQKILYLSQKNEELQRILDQKDGQINNLMYELDKKQVKKSQLTPNLSTTVHPPQQPSQLQQELLQEIQLFKTKFTKQHSLRQNLEAMLNQSQFQKQELRRQFIQMSNRYQKKQKQNKYQVKDFEIQLARFQQTCSVLEIKLKDRQKFTHLVEQKNLELLTRIQNLNSDLDKLEGERHEANKQNSKLRIAFQSTLKQLQSIREKSRNSLSLAELQKDQIIFLRTKIQGLQQKIMKYVSMLEDSDKTIASLKLQRQNYLKEFVILKADNLQKKTMYLQYKQQCDALHEQYEQMKQRLRVKSKEMRSNENSGDRNRNYQ